MNNHVPKPATLNTAYSIFIDMQLSTVGGGWQRIIGSAGWGDTGLYVKDTLMIYPPGAGIKCREKLLPNRAYKIGMTRSLEGEVKLYMNGAMCAHGTPLFNKGFTLDQVHSPSTCYFRFWPGLSDETGSHPLDCSLLAQRFPVHTSDFKAISSKPRE